MKLNNKLIINCTTQEKEKLKEVANKFGLNLNWLCRGLLNSQIRLILSLGQACELKIRKEELYVEEKPKS